MTSDATNADDMVRRVGRPPGPAPDPEVRRAELLEAAERVIRARGPDVGMDDIAAEIGLTKPAVYRSLGDKADLTAALGQRVTARLAEQLAAALARPVEDATDTTRVRRTVASCIDVFCRFVDEDTNLYRFIVHGSIGVRHTGMMDKPLVVNLGELISGSLAAGARRVGADPDGASTWAYAIIGAVFAATEHWLHHQHVSRAELVARLAALVSPALEHAGDAPAPDTARSRSRDTARSRDAV